MYLDAAVLNHNRKERTCGECKGTIEAGADNLMLMRRGRKGGRYYIYLHPCCFLRKLWRERERRRVKDPKAAGRPAGSVLATLDPEERKERHRLIRARARLLRIIVTEDDLDEVRALLIRTRKLRTDIDAILPLQITGEGKDKRGKQKSGPGHRSKETSRILQDKIQAADRRRE